MQQSKTIFASSTKQLNLCVHQKTVTGPSGQQVKLILRSDQTLSLVLVSPPFGKILFLSTENPLLGHNFDTKWDWIYETFNCDKREYIKQQPCVPGSLDCGAARRDYLSEAACVVELPTEGWAALRRRCHCPDTPTSFIDTNKKPWLVPTLLDSYGSCSSCTRSARAN